MTTVKGIKKYFKIKIVKIKTLLLNIKEFQTFRHTSFVRVDSVLKKSKYKLREFFIYFNIILSICVNFLY